MQFVRTLQQNFGRSWRLLLRHRWSVLAGLLCIPVHSAILLWTPRLFGEAIDMLRPAAAIGGDDPAARRQQLQAVCGLLLGLALLEGIARYVARKTLIDASRHVERDLKDALMAHLGRLPVAWYDRSRTGDIVSRMTQDIELVRFVMGPLLLHGGSAVCLLPTGMWLMAQMNVPVTLAAAAAFALLFALLRLFMPRLHKWSKRAQEAIGDLSQRAQEDFAGIRVLFQFGATARERAAMATRNRRYLFANLRLVRLRALVNAVTHSTSGVVTLGVLVVGGYEVVHDQLTAGQLFQFILYLAAMLFPLEILGWTLATMPRALAAAVRIEELFAVAPESDAGIAPPLRGALVVRGLTYSYPEQERPALRNVSFELPAGGKLGLCGPVGSGKSTLLALVLRFYDPPRGTVFVDGHDVLDLRPSALRAAFAYAPQEPFLFSDTIAANVAFARDAMPAAALATAVVNSALDQDLDQFPLGLETVVGERGVTLSGGQKQRVSLARALASERSALLLDDTISAVDPATERRILAGLRSGRGARSMLVASHRLSALADADLILAFDAGVVQEQGSHRELLARGGSYAAAWRRQSEARALEGEELP